METKRRQSFFCHTIEEAEAKAAIFRSAGLGDVIVVPARGAATVFWTETSTD